MFQMVWFFGKILQAGNLPLKRGLWTLRGADGFMPQSSMLSAELLDCSGHDRFERKCLGPLTRLWKSSELSQSPVEVVAPGQIWQFNGGHCAVSGEHMLRRAIPFDPTLSGFDVKLLPFVGIAE